MHGAVRLDPDTVSHPPPAQTLPRLVAGVPTYVGLCRTQWQGEISCLCTSSGLGTLSPLQCLLTRAGRPRQHGALAPFLLLLLLLLILMLLLQLLHLCLLLFLLIVCCQGRMHHFPVLIVALSLTTITYNVSNNISQSRN